MAAVPISQTEIRVLNPKEAILRNHVTAFAGECGNWVILDTDGTLLAADATDTIGEAQWYGQVIATAKAIGGDSSGAFAVGDTVTVAVDNAIVYLGPDAALTIPGLCYISATAGEMDQTAPVVSGNYVISCARAISATVIHINANFALPVVV